MNIFTFLSHTHISWIYWIQISHFQWAITKITTFSLWLYIFSYLYIDFHITFGVFFSFGDDIRQGPLALFTNHNSINRINCDFTSNILHFTFYIANENKFKFKFELPNSLPASVILISQFQSNSLYLALPFSPSLSIAEN